jgi:CubicO group peptidase (beta-lactamase class C family)
MDSPAGDGVTNLMKYALGVPPLESAAQHMPKTQLIEQGGAAKALELIFPINPNAQNLRYDLEVSKDLVTWATVPYTTNLDELPTGTQLMHLRELQPQIAPCRFARIKVNYSAQEWPTAEPAKVGIDPAAISEILAQIRRGERGSINSFLVLRHGLLVSEGYFPGPGLFGEPYQEYDKDTMHRQYSVTKSVVSTLIGIALDEGTITSIDTPVADFFPQYPELRLDAVKKTLTLRHLLSMTSGLAWDEQSLPYDNPANSHYQMDNASDPIRFVLDLPLESTPGTAWNYSSGVSMVLGAIVKAATGKSADEYAVEKLFNPLGIHEYRWDRYPGGEIQTGGGLHLRPRDMAKFGSLLLNEGMWEGKRILSKAWVAEATNIQAGEMPYGYQWWIVPPGIFSWSGYMAIGIGGQYIFVLPDLDMVVVFTGGNTDDFLSIQPQIIVNELLIPAVTR